MFDFMYSVYNQIKTLDLDREENRFISKFRTDISGLNRMKVIKRFQNSYSID